MQEVTLTKSDRLEEALGLEWYRLLREEFEEKYMKDLSAFVSERRRMNVVYPEQQDVFNAFKLTPYSQVKVVIVGQDPYIKEGEAHGLAFSTKNGKSTPSLRQIAKAVDSTSWDNNLTRWATQGVFLLNTVLTVDKGSSNSHAMRGWEIFTAEVLKMLVQKNDCIFLLWGAQAQRTMPSIIFDGGSKVITAEHPVAASYRGQDWKFNDCFNLTNQLLRDKGQTPIQW